MLWPDLNKFKESMQAAAAQLQTTATVTAK